MKQALVTHARYFSAPWGKALKVVSVAVSLLLIGISLAVWFNLPKSDFHVRLWILSVALLLPFCCALFMIRGYRLEGRSLLIQRWLWQSRISLEGLRHAQVDAEAMGKALRICGNGGLFSITGWYRSKQLGLFRAYVTDLKRTVVLTFARRKIVISPDRPEAFVAAVMQGRGSNT